MKLDRSRSLELLKQAIKERGLTQSEVAVMLGVKPQSFRAVLCGHNKIGPEYIMRVLNVLNIDIGEFYKG